MPEFRGFFHLSAEALVEPPPPQKNKKYSRLHPRDISLGCKA